MKFSKVLLLFLASSILTASTHTKTTKSPEFITYTPNVFIFYYEPLDGQIDDQTLAEYNSYFKPLVFTPEEDNLLRAWPQELKRPELPLYKENKHFAFYCQPEDEPTVNTVIEQCETYLKQLSINFNHLLNTKITFKIYPNIDQLHEAAGNPNAPDWICCRLLEKNIFLSVSPNNPGTYHTSDFVRSNFIFGLTEFFINNKYTNTLPGWLRKGICLYKSAPGRSEYYQIREKELAKNINNLPTLQQLTNAYTSNDALEINKIDGWNASCSLVKFLDKKWGWETIQALLTDFTQLHEILGVTEEELRTLWIEYLHQTYPN